MADPQTTLNSAKAWSPDVVATSPEDSIPDALVLQATTVAGRVQGDEPALRVPYVDDAEASFVSEGSEIGPDEPDLNEVTVYTGKIAQMVRLSREQFQTETTSQLISNSVSRAVTNAANKAFLSQDKPSDGNTPPAGLLNIDGIHEGANVDDNLDPIADALAHIEAAGGEGTHMIVSPTAWGFLRNLKTADNSNESLLGAGTDDAERRLFNLPVLSSAGMPDGKLLLLDQAAIVSAVGSVNVAQSVDRYFEFDQVALRCTFRFGANVVRPDRVAVVDVNNE